MSTSDEAILGGAEDRVAVDAPGWCVTYAQLEELVSTRTAELAAQGVSPGTRLALQAPPSPAYLVTLLAALQLGTELVLVDPRSPDAERNQFLRRHPVDLLLLVSSRGAMLRFAPDARLEAFPGLGSGGRGRAGVVQFSSGSTGEPKVVHRSTASIRREIEGYAATAGWVRGSDRVLVLNSLCHSFGLYGALLRSLAVGATVVLAVSPIPKDLAAAVARCRPTVVTGVPAHIDFLARMPVGALAEVRACVSGGQVLDPSVGQRFLDVHGVRVGQAFGLTEVGIVAMDVDGSLAPAVGHVLPWVQARVEDGQLVIGVDEWPYPLDPVTSPWLRTGDRASFDNAGVLHVHGRADGVLVVGGLNVDLGEVESAIRSLAGVKECVVLAAGGAVVAFVESTELSASDVHAFTSARLAGVKRPRTVTVMPQLPRTSTGKPVRRLDVLTRAGSSCG